MMIVKTTPSVSYSMWLKRILDRHTSQDWDAEPTALAEREDDELNDLWTDISDCQKQRLWGLSADLHTLRDRETWVETDWRPMTQAELGQAQLEAFQRKEWDRLLEYLRRPPRFLPRNTVDSLRGRAWKEMGHPEVALLFFDNAARLEPDNASYRVLAMECLKTIQDWPEVLQRCEAYVLDAKSPPRVLFLAADALHVYANQTGAREYYERAIRTVEQGFSRVGSQQQMDSVIAGAYATKSLCLEHLDRREDSLKVLDEAVARFPENTTLLTARGLLKQVLGRSDAIDDFRVAVEQGAIAAWAYIEVARHAIGEDRMQWAVELCRKGLAVAQSDSVRAILYEFMGIALLQLKEPTNAVRAAFQMAGSLDPLNERIRESCERFERFAADPSSGEPQWQLDAAPREVALDEVYAQLQRAA